MCLGLVVHVGNCKWAIFDDFSCQLGEVVDIIVTNRLFLYIKSIFSWLLFSIDANQVNISFIDQIKVNKIMALFFIKMLTFRHNIYDLR